MSMDPYREKRYLLPKNCTYFRLSFHHPLFIRRGNVFIRLKGQGGHKICLILSDTLPGGINGRNICLDCIYPVLSMPGVTGDRFPTFQRCNFVTQAPTLCN